MVFKDHAGFCLLRQWCVLDPTVKHIVKPFSHFLGVSDTRADLKYHEKTGMLYHSFV